MAETFNSWIVKIRDKPIITMLESIRKMVMEWFATKKEFAKSFAHEICPNIQKLLEKVKEKSNEGYEVLWDGRDTWEVEHYTTRRYIVKLNERSCSCQNWDLTGIPCVHAIAAIYYQRELPENYVDPYFSIDMLKKAYSGVIGAIPGIS